MKTFVKNDFYIQFYILLTVIAFIILGIFVLGYAAFLFYFVVGISQLISFIIKAFQKTKKSWMYIVYGIFIMPVWISWLIVLAFNSNNDVTNFFGCILIASIFYSPVLAIIYVYDCYKLYKF